MRLELRQSEAEILNMCRVLAWALRLDDVIDHDIT